jgi:hypothetical protein
MPASVILWHLLAFKAFWHFGILLTEELNMAIMFSQRHFIAVAKVIANRLNEAKFGPWFRW